ncbi:hypothetical protein [Paenibacillus validus]|nr:hypothetical protein [Paenibacillus validus]
MEKSLGQALTNSRHMQRLRAPGTIARRRMGRSMSSKALPFIG